MKVNIQSIHFDADEKLLDFIQKRLDKLETYYDNTKNVFFTHKHAFWNDVEKDIGLKNYNGYREYELYIDDNLFTESLNPRSNNKILKITKNNIRKVNKLFKNCKRPEIRDILLTRNIIGIDNHYSTKSSLSQFIDELVTLCTPEQSESR